MGRLGPEPLDLVWSRRPLPVALPRPADRRLHRIRDQTARKRAVVLAAVVFQPRGLVGVLIEVLVRHVVMLAEMIGDKEPNVRNRLSRGKFTAAFLLHCLAALGVQSLRLD